MLDVYLSIRNIKVLVRNIAEENLLQATVKLKIASTVLKILKIRVPQPRWEALPLISTAVATARIVIGDNFFYIVIIILHNRI